MKNIPLLDSSSFAVCHKEDVREPFIADVKIVKCRQHGDRKYLLYVDSWLFIVKCLQINYRYVGEISNIADSVTNYTVQTLGVRDVCRWRMERSILTVDKRGFLN